MTEPNLVLIGTDHMDLWGEERLERAFDAIKPDILTVEALSFTQGQIPECVIDEAAARAIMIGMPKPSMYNFGKYLRGYGYETRTAKRFADRGGKVRLIDVKPDGKIKLPRNNGSNIQKCPVPPVVDTYLSFAKIGLNTFDGDDTLASLYALSRMAGSEVSDFDRWVYNDFDYTNLTGTGNQEDEFRDAGMGYALRQLRGNGARIMHVGGLNHLFGNHFNLYSHLGEFAPQRRRLNEF